MKVATLLKKHKIETSLGILTAIVALAISNSVFNFWSVGPKAFDSNVSGQGNVVVINARTISDLRPEDVPCKGTVTVGDTSRGKFYRAVLGDVHLTWTEGDQKVAMTDGKDTAYKDIDGAIRSCLEGRATLVGVH